MLLTLCRSVDWEDKETYGASLAAKAGAGADAKKAATGLNSLWDDNWDDDDVADDFSVQLRCVAWARVASRSRRWCQLSKA